MLLKLLSFPALKYNIVWIRSNNFVSPSVRATSNITAIIVKGKVLHFHSRSVNEERHPFGNALAA